MRGTTTAALAAFGVAVSMLFASAAQARLKVDDTAPAFVIDAAVGGRDVRFSLTEALAKGPVVVFFYPKSFTAVCTEEANMFADAMDEFGRLGASVIGISADTIETQRKFSSLECRDKFPVGADPDRTVIDRFGVAFGVSVARLPFADRVSYVIAPDGRIVSAVKDFGARAHVEGALAAVRAWRAAQPR